MSQGQPAFIDSVTEAPCHPRVQRLVDALDASPHDSDRLHSMPCAGVPEVNWKIDDRWACQLGSRIGGGRFCPAPTAVSEQ
jgi:hypothetical protein